jgi:Thermostable hemolysin
VATVNEQGFDNHKPKAREIAGSTIVREPRTVTPRFQIGFAFYGTPHYQECVDLAKRKYLDRYGAVVDPRPDMFVTAWDSDRDSPTYGRTLGIAGLTGAAGRRLLSESYLDLPVEQVCAELAGVRPDRDRIAQMGPLASFYPGGGMFLMRNLPRVAAQSGYDFLLSTLTEDLHDIARAAGWDFQTLANARRDDVADTSEWGTYYSTRPRAGVLRCGRRVTVTDTNPTITAPKESSYALA